MGSYRIWELQLRRRSRRAAAVPLDEEPAVDERPGGDLLNGDGGNAGEPRPEDVVVLDVELGEDDAVAWDGVELILPLQKNVFLLQIPHAVV